MKKMIYQSLMAAAVVSAILTAAPARAAEGLRSAWDALPPEAVLMLHVPAGNDFVDALRKQTKYGAVGWSQERIDKLVAILKDESQGQWETMSADLVKYNLKPEDWHDLLAGDAGFAVALLPRVGQHPLVVGLTWFEPGGDLAQRLVTAMLAAADDHKGQNNWPDERVDSVIDGNAVTRLTMWYMGRTDSGQDSVPPDMANMTPEQKQQWNKKKIDDAKNAKPVMLDQVHMLITRIGNRVLIANTFPQSTPDVQKQLAAAPGAKIDFATVTGLEPATALFARFLAAQTGKGEGAGAVATLMATPGLAEAMPAGQTAFEILVDPRPLVALAAASENAMVPRMVKALGFDTLGPVAFRNTLDGNLMRSGTFVSVPAPRRGLMSLLDQDPLAPQPPAWAPTAAMTFTAVSFDLGKAYLRIKDMVIGEMGDQAASGFQMAEGQVQMQLQVELPVLLSSLGHTHNFLTLLPEIPVAPVDAPGAAPAAPGSARHVDGPPPVPAQRTAFVWEVTDPALWKKVFDVITPMAAGTAGPPVQEQGFTGWRMNQGGTQMALFLGDKYLTMDVGPGVSEQTLAWLRTPPEGKDAIRTSPLYERAKAIGAMEPCLLYQISDMNRSVRTVREIIKVVIDQFAASQAGAAARKAEEADEDDDGKGDKKPAPVSAGIRDPKALAARLKALLPTDEELEGMFGVSYSQVIVKGPGVTATGVVEVPPPGK